MNRYGKSSLRGSTLVLVAFAIVVLSILGAGLLRLGLGSRVKAIRNADEISARCAADAGLTKAVYAMNQRLGAKAWSDSGLPSTINESLPGCGATFDYSVAVGSSKAGLAPGGGAGTYLVRSIGRRGQAQKVITAELRLKGLWEDAILTQEALEGYNSQDPKDLDADVTIATTSTGADSVTLNLGVVIDGDIRVGVDGDPATVIKDAGGTVTGLTYAMTEEIEFPVVTAPTLPVKGASISAKDTTLTLKPADSGAYTGIDLKSASTPCILEIAGGDVVLHITGNIDLGNACELIVRKNASLKLYVDGDIHCRNGSSMGNEALTLPEKLQLYATGSTPQTFDLKAKNEWCGTIYAPNADVDLYAKGDASGSVVAYDFEYKSGGKFRYDEALRNVTVLDDGVRFTVKRWQE
jgi:hypothetical protein